MFIRFEIFILYKMVLLINDMKKNNKFALKEWIFEKKENIEEANAISTGGGNMQSTNLVSATGGVPLKSSEERAKILWGKKDSKEKVKTDSEEIQENPAIPSEIENTQDTKTNENNYFYHGTNLYGVQGIKDTGKIKIFRPWHGTEQEVWPDGSIEKRAYFSPTAKGVEPFFPETGPYFVLRVSKANANFKKESGTPDFYVTNSIPIKFVEIFNKTLDSWVPLQEFKNN